MIITFNTERIGYNSDKDNIELKENSNTKLKSVLLYIYCRYII